MKKITLVTPRGTLSGVEMGEKDAGARDYSYYFDSGSYHIYIRTDCDTWHTEFAFVKK